MKKTVVALLGFFLLASKSDAQVNWSVVMGKQRFSQGFALPIKDTLSYMALMDSGAVVLRPSDSALYYRYKSKWQKVGAGGGPTIDTTSLSNRINARIDSLRRSNDSIFARKNGAFVFQYKDSVGGGNTVVYSDTAKVVIAKVYNAEATTLTRGTVVYLKGANGDVASVRRANNKQDSTSSKTFGVVRRDIAAGDTGYITTQGQIEKLNLGSYVAGDILYLDSVNGQFTKVKPTAPLHQVFIGVVERANNGNGLAYIKPQNGYELSEIHDVKIGTLANNQTLVYNSALSVWENKSVYTIVDTTSLSNRINGRIDSLRRSNDSIFARKNGVFVFQYKDSIGGGSGSTPTLSQVVNAGNVVNDNTILLTYTASNYSTLWANKSGTPPFISFDNNNDTSYLRADKVHFFNKGLFDTSGAHVVDLGLDSTLSRLALRWGNKNGSEVVKYKSLLPAYNQDIDQSDNHTYFLPDMNDTTAKYLVTSVNNKRANIMGDVTMGSDCATASLVGKFTHTNTEPAVFTWEYFCNQTGVTYSMFHYTDNKFRLVDNAVNTSQDPTFTNVWLGGVQFKNEVQSTEYYANIYKIDDHTVEISVFRNTGDPSNYVENAMFEVRFYGSAPTSGDTTNPY